MRLIKNYIKQNLNIVSLLKIIWVIFVIWFFISSPTFAQDQTTWQDGLEYFNMTLNTILSLLSRLRIFLSSLAGKLMTNDWVYGSVMHLDIYLWKIWNIMKNFANFVLVGLVLVEIVKIATNNKSSWWVSKIFTKTLLAAVLIQVSRFVMWAVIDISNITVSAVWSFPRVFMQDNKEVLSGLQTFADNFQQSSYEIDFATNDVIKKINGWISETEQDDLIQSILPSTNSVSGPLIFMWASIFRFNEYSSIPKFENTDWKKITLSTSLKLLVIFFYTAALMFLVVANLIRIWFLWIFIVLSPIIVLYMTSFMKPGKDSISKYFDIWNILGAIFKPTIFVWYISLMLIVLVLIRSFFVTTPSAEIWGVSIVANADSSKLSIEEIGNVEIKWNILKDSLSQGQSMFSDLFVFLLWIFLMWQLVKLAISGKWPIWDTMNRIWINHDLLKWAMSNLPVMPWGFGFGAYKSAMQNQTREVLKWANINRDWRWWFTANLDKEWEAELEGKINKYLNIKSNRSEYKQWISLEETIRKSPEKFWSESIEISKNIQWWLSISNTNWMEYFKKWLDKQWVNSWFKWKLASTWVEDIKTFFGNKDNVVLFHNYMQDAWVKWLSYEPKTYEDLQKISYGTKSE